MTWSEVAVVVVAFLAVAGLNVWIWATRIDRLHRRADAMRASLEIQLARRAGAALDLARSGAWDPVSSLVVAEVARAAIAASDAAEVPFTEQGTTHSELSQATRAALGQPEDMDQVRADPAAAALLEELAAAWYRVEVARRFYNEAIAEVTALRSKRAVRFFHLAGTTSLPGTFDMDDLRPEGLGVGEPLASTPR